MSEPILSLADLNARNRVFWDEQRILTDQRMADEVILEIAVQTINSEFETRRPFALKKSFEIALEEAHSALEVFKERFAQKGGKAKKTDLLQQLIQDIVQRRPDVTRRHLLDEELPKFTTHAVGSEAAVIDDISDSTISFFTRKWKFDEAPASGSGDGSAVDEEIPRPTKLAPIKGLKDRLSRAKKFARANPLARID